MAKGYNPAQEIIKAKEEKEIYSQEKEIEIVKPSLST